MWGMLINWDEMKKKKRKKKLGSKIAFSFELRARRCC